MLITHYLFPRTIPADKPPALPPVSRALAEKIVNIAGIGEGDRVLVSGQPGTAIEAAINGSGARLFTAAGNAVSWPVMTRACADAVFGAVPVSSREASSASSRLVRRHLRPGGRWVVWAVADRDHDACIIAERFHRLLRSAGFTSIIVGQVPPGGGGAVVATGILKSTRRNREKLPVAAREVCR